MDIDSSLLDSVALSLDRRTRRGRSAPATLAYVRDLGPGDAEELLSPPPTARREGYNTAGGSGLKRLRHTHHLAAMVLAEGASAERAAALTGYSPATIAVLQRDPAFCELIAHYRTATMAEFEEVRARAASLGLSFLDELQDRLEESPEGFTNKELRESASMLLDRTILPSKSAAQGTPSVPAAPPRFEITFVAAQSALVEAPAPRTIELAAKRPPEESSDAP